MFSVSPCTYAHSGDRLVGYIFADAAADDSDIDGVMLIVIMSAGMRDVRRAPAEILHIRQPIEQLCHTALLSQRVRACVAYCTDGRRSGQSKFCLSVLSDARIVVKQNTFCRY